MLSPEKAERLKVAGFLIGQKRWYEAARVIWPWMRANPLTEKIYRALDEHDKLAVMGHAASSKTFSVTQYLTLRWLASPHNTTVLLTAPTLTSLKHRAWNNVKMMWEKAAIPLHGEPVNYEMRVRLNLKDEQHNILCVAGEHDQSEHKIRGLHPENLFILIDEADNPNSESIWNAIPNLLAMGKVQIIALTNPTKKQTRFGDWCEPPLGWSSVDKDRDKAWEAKSGAYVMRLDGVDSPNIVAGRDIWNCILTNAGKREYEKEGVNSIAYAKYFRAWFPDDGACKYIFPSEIIDLMQRVKVLFYADSYPCAGIDPAYAEEGDKLVVTIGECGREAKNPKKTVIRFRTAVRVERKDKSKLLTEDLGDQIIQILEDHHVRPDLCAIDTTGNGLALSDYIRAKWSREVLPVEFGGASSDTRILAEDTRPASARFHLFVTELWFAARDWARAGLIQMSVMPRPLRIDLEARLYDDRGNNKIQAEPKTDMRKRGLNSPDYGDSFCLLVHVVRMRFADGLPVTVAQKARARKRMSRTVFKQEYSTPGVSLQGE